MPERSRKHICIILTTNRLHDLNNAIVNNFSTTSDNIRDSGHRPQKETEEEKKRYLTSANYAGKKENHQSLCIGRDASGVASLLGEHRLHKFDDILNARRAGHNI